MRTTAPCWLLTSPLTLVLILACSFSTGPAFAEDASDSETDEKDLWVTAVTTLGDDQQTVVMATANGLLLRESSVLTASSSSPNHTEQVFVQPTASWAVAATPDGSTVFSSDYRGNLTLYNVAEKSSERQDEVFERWTRALACSPDGKQLLAGNEGGKLFVWDIAEKEVSNSVELDASAVMDIAFSGDGQSVAVADGAGHVHFLNWPKLDAIGQAAVADEAIWAVSYEPDGKQLLAAAADNHLYRLPAKADAEAKSIVKGSDWITDVAQSKQGAIAAAEFGGRVHLLSAEGTPLGPALEAPSGVWTLCWTESGNLLVGTRKDGVQVVEQQWGWGELPTEKPPAEEAADTDAKPDEKKPDDKKPDDKKPDDKKPDDKKPDDKKPDDKKPDDKKPDDKKPDEKKPDDAEAES